MDFQDELDETTSQRGTYMQRASTTRRREYQGGDSDSNGYRRPHQDQRPPDRGRYPNGNGRPPDQGGYPGGGPPDGGRPLEEDILVEMGDPLEEEDSLVEDGPLMEVEDPLMEEDPLDLLGDKDHQAL